MSGFKYMSDGMLEDLDEILNHRPRSLFRPDSDKYMRCICEQAKEANRMRDEIRQLIYLLRDDIRHKHYQTCQDEQKVSDQAREANRLREGMKQLIESNQAAANINKTVSDFAFRKKSLIAHADAWAREQVHRSIVEDLKLLLEGSDD